MKSVKCVAQGTLW